MAALLLSTRNSCGTLPTQQLRLDSELKRLDRYPAIILDDLGHVQQDRQEMEGLRDCLNRAYC